MNKKLVSAAVLALILVFSVTMADAYTSGHGKSKKGYHYKSEKHKDDLESKFYRKAMLVYKKRDELGLSEKQAKSVKSLKLEAKKDLIRKKAEIEIIALDIKAKLWEDEVDAAGVNKLIDRKYELKKEKAKALVGAYATLKDMLSAKQKEKLKELYKECKKGKD